MTEHEALKHLQRADKWTLSRNHGTWALMVWNAMGRLVGEWVSSNPDTGMAFIECVQQWQDEVKR